MNPREDVNRVNNISDKFFNILNSHEKNILKDFVDNNRDYFNSPESFLLIAKSRNLEAFRLIMRHINTQSMDEKEKFLTYTDGEGKHVLMLAAELNYQQMIIPLLRLEFDLGSRDKKNNSILTYLIKNNHIYLSLLAVEKMGRINVDDARLFSKAIENGLSCKTKNDRKKISNALTYAPDKVDQRGRLSKTILEEEKRNPRTFRDDREKQLLRHVAVQLYHGLKKGLQDVEGLNGKLVEVQIMHLDFGGKHTLFIAANEHAVSQKLVGIIGGRANFKEMLTSIYLPKDKKDKEGAIRSKRYAGKLRDRIFGDELFIPGSEDKDDKEQSEHLARLLYRGVVIPFPIETTSDGTLSKFSKIFVGHMIRSMDEVIYIVSVSKCPIELRHAEEFLADIADCATQLGKELNKQIYTSVAGKKRPCITCFSTMEGGRVSKHGSYPGRFWVNTLENKSISAAPRTVRALLVEKSHVTVGRNGEPIHDYDTASDSEIEDYNEVKHEAPSKVLRL
jgi:hypothetical protein